MSTGYVYLSFADTEKGFLGCCIVRGTDVVEGTIEAHRLGINPGGEVACIEVPDGDAPFDWLANTNRLMSFEDMEAIGAAPVRLKDVL